MGLVVVVQPEAGWVAEVAEPSPGVKQLVCGDTGVAVCVQVPARIGGLTDSARFARQLASAAAEFAAWCEQAAKPSTAFGTSLADRAEDIYGPSRFGGGS